MKKAHVTLNDSDRTYLENLVKKGGVPTRTYKRAIALLELDRGRTFTAVAETVGVVIQTVSIWANKGKDPNLSTIQK